MNANVLMLVAVHFFSLMHYMQSLLHSWSYGRGETARDQHSLAPYSSVRESDYGSAACVLLPRALFLALDLYDRYFLPAYYEDTDMAFQIRQRAGIIFS